MVQRLRMQAERAGARPAQLRTIVYGGGPMYVEELKKAMAVFGQVFVQIYGQGEAPMTITCLRRSDHASSDDAVLGLLFGDAYGVQHHGGESAQAIQSVAVHLLDIHAIVTGRTTQPGWGLGRAIRKRGVFHKLTPPPLGSALTIRHLFLGGGVATPITRAQYVASVYEAWMSLHRRTVEEWYDRYVAPDDMR